MQPNFIILWVSVYKNIIIMIARLSQKFENSRALSIIQNESYSEEKIEKNGHLEILKAEFFLKSRIIELKQWALIGRRCRKR